MREEFWGAIDVPTSEEQVWEAVLDFPTIASWISVVGSLKELVPLEHYTATLQDRLGPFKLHADLDILLEVSERVLRARANGEDRQAGSHLDVRGELCVLPRENGTRLQVEGFYAVVGVSAMLGASTIRRKGRLVLEQFFGRLSVSLLREPSGGTPNWTVRIGEANDAELKG